MIWRPRTKFLKNFMIHFGQDIEEFGPPTTKSKKRYWWKGLYKDVEDFVASCVDCQLQSKVRYRDELHPTYPLAIHF